MPQANDCSGRDKTMQKIQAFKCEVTGGVFDQPEYAARSEFKAMMRKAGNQLPCLGSIDPKTIMDWLTSALQSNIYPSATKTLMEALKYFHAHHLLITGSDEPPHLVDKSHAALIAAKEKIEKYRASGHGDYVGGMEYTTLMRLIHEALAGK